ncbi:MAG: M48 family metallopeptidase [Clostridiales bacterium]|nr:M48 family metallopeptidase [Clostridiales bacterium]MBR6254446.1 M48 family metallopeptidase [Clostridiales bacterium]MCR5275902.1 M48 family metallopeptidase [Clostridiales bacterium]
MDNRVNTSYMNVSPVPVTPAGTSGSGLPPFTKKEIRSFRHKAEKPLYITMVILNILMFVIGIIICILAFRGEGPLTEPIGDFVKEELLGISRYVQIHQELLAILILLPFMLMAAVYLYYAQYRANSIRITEKNFPEIYAVVEDYSRRLGLKKTPKVYLTQENGLLNAFSTFILRRQYVVLLADLFEVAYLEHHDLESIKFIIAHEMSHIRLRHATFSYQISILFANYIPILSSTLSRAREYSCDRVAQHLVGVSGVEPMLALIVGKHLYKKVDVEDYVKHCHETRGFFVFVLNMLSTHPIMPKRIQALLKDHGSGRLFF